MLHDVITLVAQSITKDTYGIEVITESKRTVFAEVESISQSEFFAAADTELNPEYRFRIFFGDYKDEEILEYQEKRYAIYRTYRSGDYMELYTERKVGV